MKKLPQTIDIFKINRKQNTIRYEQMWEDEMRWAGADIFKCLFFIFGPLAILLIVLEIELHISTLTYIGYVLFGLTWVCFIALVIGEIVIEKAMWEKQVAETYTLEYDYLKAIYRASYHELWLKLDKIRNKDNPTIAERKFYEKYKELYDHEYVEYIDIPLWSVLSN